MNHPPPKFPRRPHAEHGGGARPIAVSRPQLSQKGFIDISLRAPIVPLRPITRTPTEEPVEPSQKQPDVLGWLLPCREGSPLPSLELRRDKSEYKVGRQVSVNDLVFSHRHISEYYRQVL